MPTPPSFSKLVVLVAGLLVATGLVAFGTGDDYELQVLVPSAEGALEGAPAFIDGFPAGTVTDVGVQGDSAKLTVEIDEEHAPLHAGTVARIGWNSLLGRRLVEVMPGPEANPELPDGQLVESDYERVELDDVMAALDAPTRRHVQQLVSQLDATLQGRERDLNRTLDTAGPFVGELGAVLEQIGGDGPAIRSLVSRLRQITATLAARDRETAQTVTNLSALVQETVTQQRNVAAALAELPATASAGTRFFRTVPPAVDRTVALLHDVRPATQRLPSVARKLNPVLSDLRPTVDRLRPTLAAARSLLRQTPGLLDTGAQTLPEAESAVRAFQPAVTFLRPYTPEVIGFLNNWASLFSAKNSEGHFGRALVPASGSSLSNNPGVLPPGMTQWGAPAPGQLVGQPWTDANGDQVR
jgi:phospholipid/cholesterol/gamma-HCH transport system substrate-binding protein